MPVNFLERLLGSLGFFHLYGYTVYQDLDHRLKRSGIYGETYLVTVGTRRFNSSNQF